MKRSALVFAAIVTTSGSAVAADIPSYRVAPLTGGRDYSAIALNNLGEVAGDFTQYVDGEPAARFGVLWRNGQPQLLAGDPNAHTGVKSSANAINDSGVIVGSGHTSLHPYGGALHWSSDSASATGLSHRFDYGAATAVNNAGVAVGLTRDTAYGSEAMMWRNGKATVLWDFRLADVDRALDPDAHMAGATDINDRDQVVGFVHVIAKPPEPGTPDVGFARQQAVLWENGNAQLLLANEPDWYFTHADAINNSGAIVGTAQRWTADNPYTYSGSRAVVWKDGALSFLEGLDGAQTTWADDINESGWILGTSDGAATLWIDGEAIAVSSLLDSTDPALAGWSVLSAIDINDRGQVLVWLGSASGERQYALLTPVPEPATVLSMAIGLALLAGSRVRAHRRS